MADQETQGVVDPEAQAEDSQVAAQTAESNETQQNRLESEQERKRRNDVEYNWAEARRKMHEQDRQLKEANEYISRLKQVAEPKPEEDELAKLGDDEIVTKRQAMKVAEKMATQIAERVIKQREAATVEERVKLRYNDYDEVVSAENIEILKQQQPELAMSLANTPDPYAQAVAVYNAVKMIGASVGQRSVKEKDKALQNTQKPLSVNAVTKQSAIGNAHLFENGLTPELKKQLQKEMAEAVKRY